MTTTLRFRNIDCEPTDPVDTWPHEAFRAAIERGLLPDWRRIATEIEARPYGAAAATLAEVLEYTDGVGAHLLRVRLGEVRDRAIKQLEEQDLAPLVDAVSASGLSGRELARRIGTSESRLSTWLSGRNPMGASARRKIQLALDATAHV